jgi:hypothetical protein
MKASSAFLEDRLTLRILQWNRTITRHNKNTTVGLSSQFEILFTVWELQSPGDSYACRRSFVFMSWVGQGF